VLAVTTVGSSPAIADTSALSSNWYASAPYDMPLDNNPPNLTQVLAATGEKAYVLAFVLAENNSTCAPAWDGGSSVVSSSDAVASQINALRADGGDVAVSFGGYNGTKLGQVCGSASATAAAEQTGDHHLRPARDRPGPRGARVRELLRDRQRARRRADHPVRGPRASTSR
jgi:chitinase